MLMRMRMKQQRLLPGLQTAAMQARPVDQSEKQRCGEQQQKQQKQSEQSKQSKYIRSG